MQTKIPQLAAAAALVGFLAVGGASLANAQDGPSSTTTTVEEDTTATTPDEATDAPRDEDCPKDAAAESTDDAASDTSAS